jgi:FkbM family methyltransferase
MFKRIVRSFKPLIEKFPFIARLYRAFREEVELTQSPKATPWGFKFSGNQQMMKGDFEPVETKMVRSLLIDVDVIINVGANIGYYCCHGLSMGKKVIAFEPINRNLRLLYKNITINGWDNIEVYPLALSNSTGLVEIYGADTGASLVKGWAGISENFKTFTPSSTLDLTLDSRLLGEKVLLIVDVEGSERLLLDGAVRLLKNTPKPIWMIEIMFDEHQPVNSSYNSGFKDIFDLFFSYGYDAYTVAETSELITTHDLDAHINGQKRFKSHNFLFR